MSTFWLKQTQSIQNSWQKKKIKLNYEGYANGALPLYDYQVLCILYILSMLKKSVQQDKVFRNREWKVNNTYAGWWQLEPTKILVQK